jgi:hypothetical protein
MIVTDGKHTYNLYPVVNNKGHKVDTMCAVKFAEDKPWVRVAKVRYNPNDVGIYPYRESVGQYLVLLRAMFYLNISATRQRKAVSKFLKQGKPLPEWVEELL